MYISPFCTFGKISALLSTTQAVTKHFTFDNSTVTYLFLSQDRENSHTWLIFDANRSFYVIHDTHITEAARQRVHNSHLLLRQNSFSCC
mmetsp:Transcript_62509/g.123000  ORF Transcript_62509/g.123000 Transcript_62509/m.123000 type:complete len:89 (+) Transcript_62509:76-342(+)